jgi:hypothetical protein
MRGPDEGHGLNLRQACDNLTIRLATPALGTELLRQCRNNRDRTISPKFSP